MEINNILKVSLAALMVAGMSLSADAQFKGLGNRIKRSAENAVTNKIERTVDNAVDNAVNTAQNQATKALNMAVEYKTQANAPTLKNGYDVDDLYDCVEYWLELQAMANKKKDVEWLCSTKGEQATAYMNELANNSSRNNARFHTYSELETQFNSVTGATRNILEDGKPEYTGDTQYLENVLKWYVNKAKKGKTNAKRYYTLNGCATRYLAFITDRYTESNEVQKQTRELAKLWDKLDAQTQADNANSNPYRTVSDIKTKWAQYQKEQAEKKAREEAEKKAKFEASKITLKAGKLNKSLNAKALKVGKQVEERCTKVVVQSDSWNVMYEYGSPVRRTIKVWVVFRDKEGALRARDYRFQQQYMGGGKYSSELKYYGVVDTYYVKE